MKGFVKLDYSDQAVCYVAIDQIASFTAEDKYHPNEVVRVMLKDGTSLRTSWRHSADSVAKAIEEATDD